MSEKKYRVIWIDDQCKTKPGLIWDASQQGILINAFELAKDGLEELQRNYQLYDGIILDVKCLYESHNEVDSSKSFYAAQNYLAKLAEKMQDEIPCFVYSGQPGYRSNEEFENSINGKTLYTKGADDKKLLEDIKKQADLRPATKIRHKYIDSVGKLPDDIANELIEILAYLENNVTNNPDVFPKIRVVINWLMDRLNDYGLLAVRHNGANINACSLYLGKKELSKYVPLHIQRSLHSCVYVCNNGSHRIEVFNAVKEGFAPFLIRSTVFELLNILTWYCALPKDDGSIASVKEYIAKVPIDDRVIEGVLEKDGNDNYFCVNCFILPDKVDAAEAMVGDWIRVTDSTETKGGLASKYPRFAKAIERQ